MQKETLFRIKTLRPNWLEWALLGVVYLFFLFGFYFIDIGSLTGWTCTLLDALVDGRLYRLYEIIHENPLGTYHEYMGANFIILIPWAIWNIPIWIAERFFSVDILNVTISMVWSKLFLYCMAAILVCATVRIMKQLKVKEDDISWSVYMMLGPAIFAGIALAGQNDVMLIFLGVIAVDYLLKDREWMFILFMTLSMTTKPFYLFSYIAVILLIEKNILKIFGKVILPLIPVVIFNIIYMNAPMYQESIVGGSLARLIEGVIGAALPVCNSYQAPYFIMAIIVIYLIAFFQSDLNKRKDYIIYMMIAPMLVYYCFCNFEFYRLIYLAPFLYIPVALNSDIKRINVLVVVLIGALGLFLGLVNPIIDGPLSGDPFMTDTMQVNSGFMGAFGMYRPSGFDINIYGNMGDLILAKVPFILYLRQILAGVFVALMGVFIVLNEPTLKVKVKISGMEKCERWIYWIGSLSVFLVMMLLLCCYFS